MNKPSLTVVIPALNEEGNLEETVYAILGILDDRFSSCEVLIINDGSTDATGKIAERLAAKNPVIRVLHHTHNEGLGASLKHGYREAAKEYVMWFTADNGMVAESLSEMFNLIGRADLLIPYHANPNFRPLGRQVLSQAFTLIINFLFGLKAPYYNGGVIYQTEHVKSLKLTTSSFACMAETLVRLLKAGHSYVEFPQLQRQRFHGTSKAFTFKNVKNVVMAVLKLFWEIQVRGKREPAPAPRPAVPLPR